MLIPYSRDCLASVFLTPPTRLTNSITLSEVAKVLGLIGASSFRMGERTNRKSEGAVALEGDVIAVADFNHTVEVGGQLFGGARF